MTLTYPSTTPLSLPNSDTFFTSHWGPEDVVGLSISPFTNDSRSWDWNGRFWRFQLTLVIMKDSDAAVWQAFGRKLRTSAGTFNFGDPKRRSPRVNGGGTPRINGSGQTGDTIVTDGWNTGKTPIMSLGDYIEIDDNYYMVLDDANSDGSGNATLVIWPELRFSPTDNAVITVTNPQGVFRFLKAISFDANSVIYDGATFDIIDVPQGIT